MTLRFTSDSVLFFFQAEDGIRDWSVTGVQTCALPILSQWGVRTYCSEPNRGRQRWQELRTEQAAVYANRRRIRGERGRRLLRQRGEKLEQIGRASCRERG